MINQKNERLVYSGERLRLYERDQKLYDGSIVVYERVERMSTAFVLPIKEGKILIVYQQQPHRPEAYYSHVGGMIERGEDPLEGVKRELLEETGYVSKDIEQYWFGSTGKQMNQKRYVYVTKKYEKVAKPKLDAGEKIELKRVSIDEYVDMLIHDQLGGSGWREEIMLKMIDGGIDEFKEYLIR